MQGQRIDFSTGTTIAKELLSVIVMARGDLNTEKNVARGLLSVIVVARGDR